MKTPTPKQRITTALDIAQQYGTIDGAHHKMWVIDQMVRALLGDSYELWVKTVTNGPNGEKYSWDEGSAP